MTEVVDVVTGELLPAEYEPATPAPLSLFGSDDPAAALTRMKLLATLLVDVIRNPPDPKVQLVSQISGREFLSAEAWVTLGGMVGGRRTSSGRARSRSIAATAGRRGSRRGRWTGAWSARPSRCARGTRSGGVFARSGWASVPTIRVGLSTHSVPTRRAYRLGLHGGYVIPGVEARRVAASARRAARCSGRPPPSVPVDQLLPTFMLGVPEAR